MKTLGKAKKLVKAEATLAKLKAKEVRLVVVVVVVMDQGYGRGALLGLHFSASRSHSRE